MQLLGGAIFAEGVDTNVEIHDSTFESNEAGSSGGAIAMHIKVNSRFMIVASRATL
jgi:predicted outer membrane repeat protein